MLKTTKNWLIQFAYDLSLFITCDTDRPLNQRSKGKYPAWIKSASFVNQWKVNCNVILQVMRLCVRNGHDGQYFMAFFADDVLPKDGDMELFEDHNTCYGKWHDKYRRTLSAAYCGCALNWEWKAGRSDFYGKSPCGDETSMWAPQFYYCALLYRELKVTERDQLESMNPSHNKAHASHDYGVLKSRDLLPNTASTLKAEYPDLAFGEGSDEEKNFWEFMDKQFEAYRKQYITQDRKTKEEMRKKGTLKFFGKGGWKSCFTLDDSCLESRRSGTILRWRRGLRNKATDDTYRWSTKMMQGNIEGFRVDLEVLQKNGGCDPRVRTEDEKKQAQKTDVNKFYASSDEE